MLVYRKDICGISMKLCSKLPENDRNVNCYLCKKKVYNLSYEQYCLRINNLRCPFGSREKKGKETPKTIDEVKEMFDEKYHKIIIEYIINRKLIDGTR